MSIKNNDVPNIALLQSYVLLFVGALALNFPLIAASIVYMIYGYILKRKVNL